MKLKFIHYADMQIEIRTSGINAQRLDEYLFVFQKMESIVKEQKPDVVYIPGDIFEYCDANGDETKMFSKHLHAILPYVKRIIFIPGNHDVKQRNNGVIYLDVKQNSADQIDSVVTAINNPKISYYKHSGIYHDTEFPITYAVWSQLDKWSAQDPKPNYNPWIDNEVPEGALIELFHDPIRGAKDFSGQPSELFSEYGISLSDFKANTIIAGDIHSPDIIWFGENNERLFTYSSSLVQRNSGEGDYWTNLSKVVSGNSKHGYNTIEFDTDLNLATSCEFHRIHNPISRHTIRLDKNFNYETMIPAMQIEETEFNKIRVVCHAKLQEFIEHEQAIIEHLRSKYSCSVSTDWAKDVIDVQVEESEFENLDQIIDKDKILDISKKYIKAIVDKSTTIGKEDKQDAYDLIFEIFQKELMNTELTSNRTTIQLLKAEVSGFMSFARDVELSFRNNDITVISGTNGVGKTTIFHFIKWMYCDKISDFQNDRNKKLNYSLYFNDSSEEDVILGMMQFNVNSNNIYTVKKTLTREWKKGTKDIRNKNWMDNLKGTPVVKMSIESNDFNSDNTQECMEHLKSLITYKEIVRLVFVNGISLSNLINTSPEDLSAEFLNVLGLDVLNNILETFESVKDEKLNKLSKPASTLEDVITSIEKVKTAQETSVETVGLLEKDQKRLIEEQEAKDKFLNDKRTTLHQVGTKEEIKEQVDTITKENEISEKEIENSNVDIETLNGQKAIHSIDSLTKDIHSQELLLVSANSEINSHDAKVESDSKNIESLKQATVSIGSEIKNKINEQILELTTDKETLNSNLSKKNEEKRNVLKEYQNKIQESITKINTAIDEKEKIKTLRVFDQSQNKDEINKYNGLIENTKTKKENNLKAIESLKSSKVCPTCEQDKSEKAIEAIEFSIKQLVDGNIDFDKVVEEYQGEVEVMEKTKTSIENNLTKYDIEISTYKTLRDSYSKKIDVIDAEKYPELIEKDRKIDSEIEEIESVIEILTKDIQVAQDSILTTIQEDPKYIESKNNMTNASTEATEYANTKSSKEKIVSDIKLKIEELTNLKNSISDLDNSIAEKELEIKSIKEKISENNLKSIQLLKDLENANLNIEIKKEIETLESVRKSHNENLELCNRELSKEILESSRYEDKLKKLNEETEEIKKYKLVESSLKLYKKLLGKTGLPQYIFAHLVPLINKKLNETLENVDFRLLFEQDTLELRFIDLKKNVSRPVMNISGMQETLVGLALINIFRILNNSKSFNALFIDEISGKLNDGKDLSYESKNYKKITTDFIHKLSANVNIYIIDHVLEFRTARKIEIQPTDNGSIIVEIN